MVVAGAAMALLVSACGRALMEPDPAADPVANFEALWQEFDRHYSFFQLKDIDWDSLHAEFRPRVNGSTAPYPLFNVMADLLAHLEDGHVLLRGPQWTYQYREWYSAHPRNFDQRVVLNYLENIGYSPSRAILAGRWGEYGYIRLDDFATENLIQEFDGVLEGFQDVEGLILDLRDNGGGSDTNSEAVAGRFADRRRLYRRFQYRNGPDHGDFTPLQDDFITPRGPFQFTRPVAVLTNRGVFSAAESFVLAMRILPQVTIVGDTTGGGSGNPMQRELPNGWTYQLSRWIEWTPEGEAYEGVGLAPDLPIGITQRDQERERDTIMHAAAQVLYDMIRGG
jgi:hypothetical protein